MKYSTIILLLMATAAYSADPKRAQGPAQTSTPAQMPAQPQSQRKLLRNTVEDSNHRHAMDSLEPDPAHSIFQVQPKNPIARTTATPQNRNAGTRSGMTRGRRSAHFVNRRRIIRADLTPPPSEYDMINEDFVLAEEEERLMKNKVRDHTPPPPPTYTTRVSNDANVENAEASEEIVRVKHVKVPSTLFINDDSVEVESGEGSVVFVTEGSSTNPAVPTNPTTRPTTAIATTTTTVSTTTSTTIVRPSPPVPAPMVVDEIKAEPSGPQSDNGGDMESFFNEFNEDETPTTTTTESIIVISTTPATLPPTTTVSTVSPILLHGEIEAEEKVVKVIGADLKFNEDESVEVVEDLVLQDAIPLQRARWINANNQHQPKVINFNAKKEFGFASRHHGIKQLSSGYLRHRRSIDNEDTETTTSVEEDLVNLNSQKQTERLIGTEAPPRVAFYAAPEGLTTSIPGALQGFMWTGAPIYEKVVSTTIKPNGDYITVDEVKESEALVEKAMVPQDSTVQPKSSKPREASTLSTKLSEGTTASVKPYQSTQPATSTTPKKASTTTSTLTTTVTPTQATTTKPHRKTTVIPHRHHSKKPKLHPQHNDRDLLFSHDETRTYQPGPREFIDMRLAKPRRTFPANLHNGKIAYENKENSFRDVTLQESEAIGSEKHAQKVSEKPTAEPSSDNTETFRDGDYSDTVPEFPQHNETTVSVTTTTTVTSTTSTVSPTTSSITTRPTKSKANQEVVVNTRSIPQPTTQQTPLEQDVAQQSLQQSQNVQQQTNQEQFNQQTQFNQQAQFNQQTQNQGQALAQQNIQQFNQQPQQNLFQGQFAQQQFNQQPQFAQHGQFVQASGPQSNLNVFLVNGRRYIVKSVPFEQHFYGQQFVQPQQQQQWNQFLQRPVQQNFVPQQPQVQQQQFVQQQPAAQFPAGAAQPVQPQLPFQAQQPVQQGGPAQPVQQQFEAQVGPAVQQPVQPQLPAQPAQQILPPTPSNGLNNIPRQNIQPTSTLPPTTTTVVPTKTTFIQEHLPDIISTPAPVAKSHIKTRDYEVFDEVATA